MFCKNDYVLLISNFRETGTLRHEKHLIKQIAGGISFRSFTLKNEQNGTNSFLIDYKMKVDIRY